MVFKSVVKEYLLLMIADPLCKVVGCCVVLSNEHGAVPIAGVAIGLPTRSLGEVRKRGPAINPILRLFYYRPKINFSSCKVGFIACFTFFGWASHGVSFDSGQGQSH